MSAAGYDPDAPEGARPAKSQYISKKDIIVIAIVLVVLASIMIPVYKRMKIDAQRKTCNENLHQIYSAMQVYSQSHDDRLPPTHAMTNVGAPLLMKGVPVTWATVIEGDLNARAGFGCELATPDEHCRFSARGVEYKSSAFGMYAGMSSKVIGRLEDESGTIVLAESSNYGAGGSYNPVPLIDAQGIEIVDDGFLIGWDNAPGGNRAPSFMTQNVTRLAARYATEGYNSATAEPRHAKGIAVIYASGQRGSILPHNGKVEVVGDTLKGMWRTD